MHIKVNRKHIPYHRWRQQEIIQAIKERVRQKLSFNIRSVREDSPALYGAAWRMFGTWKKACQIAKVSPALLTGRKQKWSQEKILDALSEWYQQHPSPLPSFKSDRHLDYLWLIARKYFPSRNIIRRKLDLPLIRKRRWSVAKVIKYLQDRFRHSKPINTITILKENRFLYAAARYKFGSYQAAVRAAGFDFEAIRSPNKAWHFTKGGIGD